MSIMENRDCKSLYHVANHDSLNWRLLCFLCFSRRASAVNQTDNFVIFCSPFASVVLLPVYLLSLFYEAWTMNRGGSLTQMPMSAVQVWLDSSQALH